MVEEHCGDTSPASDESVFSYRTAIELMGGEQDLLIEMVEVLLEQMPGLAQAVRDAVGTGDPEALNQTAHKFKGSVSSVGARRVARVLQELENAGASGDIAPVPELVRQFEDELPRLQDAFRAFLATTRTRT